MRLATALLVLLPLVAGAEVLDRAAVRVGIQVITESALRRSLRMEAYFQNREPDLSPDARRKAAERLIDQKLVRREFELTRYAAPTMTEARDEMERMRKARNLDEEAFERELARYGFTIDDLRNEILYRMSLLRFVEFRFSPGVQVSDEEVSVAYEKEIAAPAKAGNQAPPSIDESRAELVRLLSYRKTTAALEQWLAQARQQVKIRYFEEAFQ